MNYLNKPICATAFGNTGYGSCFLEPDKFIGAIQVTADFAIRQEDVADLMEFLQGKIHAAIGSRVFPYPKFINVTDNTEDITISTTDYGDKIYVKDGFYDWTFRYLAGGVQLHQELSKNQGANKYFLYFDKNNVLYGYTTTVNGEKVLKGIPTDQFRALPWRLNTGAEAALYQLRFITDPIYLNQGNLGFLKADFNLLDIHGLQDVELSLVDLAGSVATVLAKTKISDVNMYDAFSTNLTQSAAWTAKDEDGNTITISNIAPVANADGDQGGFAVTFGAGFATADKAYLKWVAPSTLRNAPINIEGYETPAALEVEAPGS